VLIWGTGFETNEFLAPMSVTGAGGADLHQRWADGAEAYLGVTVSGFPNLFLLYGPNTNLGHNSIVFMIEQQVHLILRILARATSRGAAAADVKAEAMSGFNHSLQRRLDRTVWATSCTSWYKNAAGRITNNWSGLTTSYRRALRGSDLSEYNYLPRPGTTDSAVG
jgi:cation diffusion facilitator CzcD-associated flavoprotein CzcO